MTGPELFSLSDPNFSLLLLGLILLGVVALLAYAGAGLWTLRRKR